MPNYLKTEIEALTFTDRPRYGILADGYTSQRGAPSSIKIRLKGEKIWRRLMCWQFSNAFTYFVRIAGQELIVPDHMVDSAECVYPTRRKS